MAEIVNRVKRENLNCYFIKVTELDYFSFKNSESTIINLVPINFQLYSYRMCCYFGFKSLSKANFEY